MGIKRGGFYGFIGGDRKFWCNRDLVLLGFLNFCLLLGLNAGFIMDSESFPRLTLAKCCDCDCSCSLVNSRYDTTWLRSVKRKHDEYEEGNRFIIPGFDFPSVARVDIQNECDALREMVGRQQQSIRDLNVELEEERNAAASAAKESMSMMLRLQSEKAEVQMEARQFKRFVEGKMAHDQEEILALEDLLYKREQTIQSLTCEVQAYKYRMMSYGLTEAEAQGEGERAGLIYNQCIIGDSGAQFESPIYDYPPLKCKLNETRASAEVNAEEVDVEKFAFCETPLEREHLKNLEYRICQLEGTPRSKIADEDFGSPKNILLEKLPVNQSPLRRPRHSRKFSIDSSNPFMGSARESGPDITIEAFRPFSSFKKMEYTTYTDDSSNLKKPDGASECGDDLSDRIYTVDSVHNGASNNGFAEPKGAAWIGGEFVTTPRGSLNMVDVGDPDIQKLYLRLQALEADRESMKQTIVSMRTDKAQLILLREIAQQLCKGPSPERTTGKKASLIRRFSVVEVLKWAVSVVFWRFRAHRTKYTFGMSANNVGLQMLLDGKGPLMRRWRCLLSTQV